MSKWSNWDSDYMKTDQIYLVHLSMDESDHQYFIGTFTGRVKDILYFSDSFDNEIVVHINDYLHDDGTFHIEFIPMTDIANWASESESTDNQITTYEGIIKSISLSDKDDSIICTAFISHDKKFKISGNQRRHGTLPIIFGKFTAGEKVKISLDESNKEDVPSLVCVENAKYES